MTVIPMSTIIFKIVLRFTLLASLLFLFLSLKSCQNFYRCRVIVGEEQTFLFIQCLNCLHIPAIQHKIKYIHILDHALLVGRLRNHHYTALNQEVESSLDRALIVFLPNLCQDRICKEIFASLCKKLVTYSMFPPVITILLLHNLHC